MILGGLLRILALDGTCDPSYELEDVMRLLHLGRTVVGCTFTPVWLEEGDLETHCAEEYVPCGCLPHARGTHAYASPYLIQLHAWSPTSWQSSLP